MIIKKIRDSGLNFNIMIKYQENNNNLQLKEDLNIPNNVKYTLLHQIIDSNGVRRFYYDSEIYALVFIDSLYYSDIIIILINSAKYYVNKC